MRPVRSVMIRGARWAWVVTRIRVREDRGYCDAQRRAITIDARLRDEERLEVEIHELAHAAWPDLDEEAVYEGCRDIARALWRLGYRTNT